MSLDPTPDAWDVSAARSRGAGPSSGSRSRLWIWGPALAMMLLIFALSSLSDPPSPPGDLSDRWAHLLEYAVLGGLVLRAVARAEWGTVTASAAATAWIVSTLYGVTDEFHQWFVPGRVADPVDVVVDGAGAGLAVLLVLVWCKRMIR